MGADQVAVQLHKGRHNNCEQGQVRMNSQIPDVTHPFHLLGNPLHPRPPGRGVGFVWAWDQVEADPEEGTHGPGRTRTSAGPGPELGLKIDPKCYRMPIENTMPIQKRAD